MKRNALFSLDDNSRSVEFSELLVEAGWQIIATDETAKIIKEGGIKVTYISDYVNENQYTEFPPTLHPFIEKALTTDCLDSIELVYIIPYSIKSGNDVGGHTLLALAAKGRRIPVMSSDDMKIVVNEIVNDGVISRELHNRLIAKAYYSNITHYSSLLSDQDAYELIYGEKVYDLLNGENPYQVPASLMASNYKDSLSLCEFTKVSGDAPCFTNMADMDCILQTLCLAFESIMLNIGRRPFICIGAKHGNACGMGISFDSPVSSVHKALWGNPRSIWGGEVITNFHIDYNLAEILLNSAKREKKFNSAYWSLDMVISPSFSQDAINILNKKKSRKLFENEALIKPFIADTKKSFRYIRGGMLCQAPANYVFNLSECDYADKNIYSDDEITSLIIAWVVAFTSSHGGNEVAIAKDSALIAAAGGPSTVEAVGTAIERAFECKHDCDGSVFSVDAFFPFLDAPQLLKRAGCSIGVIPRGGIMFEEVEKYFFDNNISCIFLHKEYRGFCRH